MSGNDGWETYRSKRRRRAFARTSPGDDRPGSAQSGIVSGIVIIVAAAVLFVGLLGLSEYLESRDPGDAGWSMLAILAFALCAPTAAYGFWRAAYGVLLALFPWLRLE